MEKEKIALVLIIIGGLFALISGLYSITAGKAVISTLTNGAIFGGTTGTTLRIMGVIGVIGGIITLAGGSRKARNLALIGGILGLIAPCGLSILAIIGALLLER
ncbi:MAG: hypothetical protein F7B19_03325 [Desulfurococcales archaeon]|nr:hypothetical protein [Desulfurococcales archaeon]